MGSIKGTLGDFPTYSDKLIYIHEVLSGIFDNKLAFAHIETSDQVSSNDQI